MRMVQVIAWLWGEPLAERRQPPGPLAQFSPVVPEYSYHVTRTSMRVYRESCDTQLILPTTSSCRSTRWNHLASTLAQGPGAPRVGAGPVPPTQHSTNRTHVEPVD